MERLDDANVADQISMLAKLITEYQRNVAGVGCPPECPNFSLIDFNEDNMGCKLSQSIPDCVEAQSIDLAKWLVANGIVRTKSSDTWVSRTSDSRDS